jgi:hypothetical protein
MGISATSRFSLAKLQTQKIFCAAKCARSRCAAARAARSGSYTQKQAGSLLIFSPCSNRMLVPVDSRRHCTDVAIHSSLGGQPWRRSERKQLRKLRKSGGRRSSHTAIDLRLHKVEDRITRAGQSRRRIYDPPRRAGSGGRRRRRRDGGFELRNRARCARWWRRGTGEPHLTLADRQRIRPSGISPTPSFCSGVLPKLDTASWSNSVAPFFVAKSFR